jgi:hypothetical protein
MTLSDYIDLVATKLHRTDDASKREARKYIASRYQMIYEGCIWRRLRGHGGPLRAGSR